MVEHEALECKTSVRVTLKTALVFEKGKACLTLEPPLQAVLRGGGGSSRCCAGTGPECTLCARPGAARQERFQLRDIFSRACADIRTGARLLSHSFPSKMVYVFCRTCFHRRRISVFPFCRRFSSARGVCCSQVECVGHCVECVRHSVECVGQSVFRCDSAACTREKSTGNSGSSQDIFVPSKSQQVPRTSMDRSAKPALWVVRMSSVVERIL